MLEIGKISEKFEKYSFCVTKYKLSLKSKVLKQIKFEEYQVASCNKKVEEKWLNTNSSMKSCWHTNE